MGFNTCDLASVDSLIERWLQRLDVSTTPSATLVLFDPDRDICVDSLAISYDVTTVATITAINFGTLASAAALVAVTPAVVTVSTTPTIERADGASGTFRVADANTGYGANDTAGVTTISWGTTYVSTRNGRERGKMVIPRNTPIYMTHAGGGTGIVTLAFNIFGLDANPLR